MATQTGHLSSRSDAYPLSFAQLGIWNREQSDENAGRCQHPVVYHIEGTLYAEGLQLALNEILRRHEVLRTSYHVENGAPVQRVQAPHTVPLVMVDLRGLPEKEREVRVWQLAAEEAQRGFDLSEGFVLRAVLLRLREFEYFLILAVHDIAWDDVSTEIALRELAALYSGWTALGQLPSLPDLPIQYASFASHQRERVAVDALATEVSYWKERLEGSPNLLLLPADRPSPAHKATRCRREALAITPELCKHIESLAQQERISVFELLLSVFQTLLYRYTATEDIVIGLPASCRTPETNQSIGCFGNFLALRTDFSGNPAFRELLARVRSGVREAYDRKNLPFERLVEILDLPNGIGQTPLFQILFQQANDHEAVDLPGLRLKAIDLDPGIAHFDLTMRVTVRDDGLSCVLNYNADLFDAGTIRRMLGHYEALLESVAADADCRVALLPILSQAERQKILVEWNRTQKELPRACVHQLFEEQVQRTPEAVAVTGKTRQLTYRELNANANRLAHTLRGLGVGPDVVVGVCLKPSANMVVALLAVLKAGGAYVPLDPTHPQQRLTFMLADAQAQVVLCDRELSEGMARCTKTVLAVEDWPAVVSGQSVENPPSAVQSHNLAYILYTSGSTGKPKGVMISQRALVNLLWSAREWFDFRSGDSLLGVTTVSFDIAEVDLWLPLLTGGRSLLVGRETAADGMALMEILSTQGITFLQATPATWHILLEAGWQGKQDLRAVCTGEAMPRELAEQLLPRTQRLWNMYGPTETTIWSTGYELKSPGRVLIGRPVANTTTYILDPYLQPTPIGVAGELYIGGDGLARGYLNQPQLTSTSFISDPFAQTPDARLYKTGDLARYLPDGNIECLGRADHQVKIRGFRIELSEIEAVLTEYDGVNKAVVTAWEGTHHRRGLVAYIVPHPKTAVSEEQLRNFLRRKLPEYMLPARYVFLAALPLTANGKVDRRALPAPGETWPGRPALPAAAGDELKSQLLKLWEEVLKISPIGLQDDFFDLGGQSLLAARLFSLIEEKLGKRVSLGTLFQAPTVERLAAVLRDPGLLRQSRVCAIQPAGSRPPFFCVGGGPLFRNLAKHLGSDQPFLGLLLGEIGGLSIPYRLEEIAAHYVTALREKQPQGPYFLGGWSDGGVMAYEVAQQLQQQGQHVALLVLFDAENPAWQMDDSGLDSLGSFVDRFHQWLKLNYDLLRQVTFREAVKRLRRGFEYRRCWLRECAADAAYRIQLRVGWRGRGSTARDINDATAFAVKDYRPRPYGGRLVLVQRAARPTGPRYDAQFGWGKLVNRLEICEVRGDHRDMFLEPHVQVLAEHLRNALTGAAADSEPAEGNLVNSPVPVSLATQCPEGFLPAGSPIV